MAKIKGGLMTKRRRTMAGSCHSCKRQMRLVKGAPVCDGECAEAMRSLRVRDVLFRAINARPRHEFV